MKKISSVLILLILTCFIHAQDKNATVEVKTDKARQVLTAASKAISKKINVNEIKSFTIISEKSRALPVGGGKISQTSKVETSFALPDKIYQKTQSDQSNTQQQEKYILNGGKFNSKLDVFVDGKLQNFDAQTYADNKSQIAFLKREAFLLFFPMILDASWYASFEFNYVGIAESKDGKAEVLEAVSSNKTKYRLFFDAQTYLLLMMAENWTDKNNKPHENKFYFSDYQERGGLLIATKIITETNGETVEEKEIKDVKINPNLKPDLFEVKGN